jgi:hypothetical protein
MQECQCGGAPLDLDLFRLLITGQPCETLRTDSRNCTINGTSVATATLGAARSLNCTSACFSIFFSAPAPAPGNAAVNNATVQEPGPFPHAMVVRVSVGVVGAIFAVAFIVLVVWILWSRRHRASWNKQCESIRMQMVLMANGRKKHSGSSSRRMVRGQSDDRFTVTPRGCEENVVPECAPASETGESATSPVHDSAYDPEQSQPAREAHPCPAPPLAQAPVAERPAQPSVAEPPAPASGTERPVDRRDSGGSSNEGRGQPEQTGAASGDKGHFTSRHLFDRTRCGISPDTSVLECRV